MATLATCMRKAGKALNRGDADAIRSIYDDYQAEGLESTESATRAIAEYLAELDTELSDINAQIEAEGGALPTADVVSIAPERSIYQVVADRLTMTGIIDGDEEITNIEPTGENDRIVMRDLATALQERAKAIDSTLGDRSDRTKEILATTLADETEAAMKRSGHAGHWYSDKLANAVQLASLQHPELAEDPDAQAMFLAALAITSNGQPVAKNSDYANQQYEAYRDTGHFPEFGVGKEGQAMKRSFKLLNRLIDDLGPDGTRLFLATEFTRRELVDLGFENASNDEPMAFVTHGSAIFGPKIGGGFYQNLIGNFDPLTMDRWWMRTWGRMTGKLMEDPDSSANQGRRERLRKTLKTKPGQRKLAELGYNTLDLANEETLGDIAVLLHMEYARTNYEDKAEYNLAGKNLDEGLNDPIAMPANSSQRTWIREVVVEAQNKLQQRGLEVDTASMQALLWYPEKDLYTKYGVGDAKAQPTDYEQEFARLAESRGVSAERIQSVLRRESGRGPGGISPVGSEVEQILTSQLDPKARQSQLVRAGTANVRRTERAAYRGRVPAGAKGLVIDGAPVTTTYKPEAFAKNQWIRVGLSAPPVHELASTVRGAEVFRAAVVAAQEANTSGAAVYAYDQSEYEDMRLFLAEGGKAGLALKGDDIVSAFKIPDLDAQGNERLPGVIQSLVSLAVQQGGRRLDAFDTVLPKLYAMQGFRVVSRLAWDESQAPPNWNKETFDRYNNGEPDVVFMIWDPNNYNEYTGEGQLVETYKEAADLQAAERDAFMYPDPGPIRLRVEDDVVEDMVDQYPDHPHSQLFKLAVTVEDQADYAPSAVEALKDKVRDKGDVAIEANLALIHRNYLVDFMPDDRLSEISVYNHEIRTMEGRKGELTDRFHPTAVKMFWHKAKNRAMNALLGEVMYASTLSGMDPTKKYAPLKLRENMTDTDKLIDAKRRAEYKLLKDFHDNQLDDTARELYVEVRDQYSYLREQMEAAINSRIEQAEASNQSKRLMHLEVRKIFEAGRVQGPYFPLDRWGDRWAVAYEMKADGSAGEVYAFSKFESASEQKAWRQQMQAAGLVTKGGKRLKDEFSMAQAIDPELVQRVVSMTEGVQGGQDIANEMYQIYLRSLPEVSMRKHFMHRKGRIGFSNDIVRSYASAVFHGSTQIARMEQQPKLEQAMRRLRAQVEAAEAMDDAHSDWAAPIYNEMVTRHSLAMNPPKSAFASWATNLGFGWLLGVTPAAALLNLFQTPMFAMPTVAARKGNGTTKTTLEFAKATKEWFSTRIGGYKSKLRNDELAAYEWAEKTGIFAKTLSHDLADLIDKDDTAFAARRNIMQVVSYLFHHTEQANRQITFMSAYRLARGRDLSHQAAMMEAADLNDRSHYDYSASNRPPVMQGQFAKVILLFKNYGVHSTYQIARSFKDGFMGQEGLTDERKAEARRKFTGIMMMTAVLGGISSLPMAFLVEHVLNMVLGDEDEPYDAGNEFRMFLIKDMGWSIGQANALVSGGWDELTGGTMSTRISLSYLALGREAFAPMEGRDLYHHLLEELAGPVPSILASPILAAYDFKEDRVWRGIEKMLPKFARDLMKSVRYASEGALNYRDQTLMSPEAFTNRDLFLQAMGLTPNRLTLRYEQNKALRNMDTRLRNRRAWLMDHLFNEGLHGDLASRREAMEMINRWNMAHGEYTIGASEIMQSAKSRSRMNQQTIGGITLNPRLGPQLRADMTWLPPEGPRPVQEEEE